MKTAYSSEAEDTELFTHADAQYVAMKEALTSADLGLQSAAEVQRWLRTEQRELMRLLMQSHVTLRGQEEAVGAVVGADERQRSPVRPGKTRSLATTFGTVEVERTAYAGRSPSALYPVDGGREMTGTEVPKRQLEELARRAARDFDEFYSGSGFEADSPTRRVPGLEL